MRIRVQEAARKLGYRPNYLAASLGHLRCRLAADQVRGTLAWLNTWNPPERLHSFREFRLYWEGARQASKFYGYKLEEFCCSDGLSMKRLEQILTARNIPGILLPPQCVSPAMLSEWEAFDWSKFSVVRLGYSLTFPPAHVVGGNHLTSGLRAYDNMRRLGYSRIGFVFCMGVTTRFKAGFVMRQSEQNGPVVPLLSLTRNPENGLIDDRSLVSWLDQFCPDAVLTDVSSLRETLIRLGYRIPGDLGLAALSVLDGESDTGIYQNSEEIGRVAIDTLASLIAHNDRGIPAIPREVLIESEWRDGGMLPPRSPSADRHPRSSTTRAKPS